MNQKLRKLRTSGFSFREISRLLSISYSTARRHCKNVRMSKKGKIRYFSQLTGVPKEIKDSTILTKRKVRIINNLLFDGAVYRSGYSRSIMYINSSFDLVQEFKKDIFNVYGISPSSFEVIEGKNVVYYRIKYKSKPIYEDLLRYMPTYSTSDQACSLPDQLTNGATEFKEILLRSFWENEGSISLDGKLSADSKSKIVIEQLSKIHEKIGLNHYISRYWKKGWAYKLILNRTKENYSRFLYLKLFSKAKVTKGYFIGLKKEEVLKNYFKRKWG